MGVAQNIGQSGVNSALQTKLNWAQIENIEAQTAKTKADTNPFEWLKSNVDTLARIFGVTPDQARKFIEGTMTASAKPLEDRRGGPDYPLPDDIEKRVAPDWNIKLPENNKGLQHSREWDGKKSFDYNPRNRDGRHYWMRGYGWMTQRRLEEVKTKIQSGWN